MTDITKKFKEIELKSPKLLLHISGKVHNLHGRYATRPQEIHSTVYSQTDAVETEKEQTAKMAKVSRAKQVDVHTFPRNGTNQIVAPLGGAHGYLKGALLSSTVKYGDTSKKTSPAYGVKKKLQQGVFIEPDWIALGDTFSNPLRFSL